MLVAQVAAGRRSTCRDGPFKVCLLDLFQRDRGWEFREGLLAVVKNPAGLWVDFTPRGFKQLVLVESPKVKAPEPAADELEAMQSPAKRADELAMEVQCNGVALPTVSLTGKQLDGQDNAEPVSMLNACFTALDRALKAAAPAAGSPEEEAAAEAAAGGAGADDARAAALPPGGAHSMEPYHFSLREIRVPSKDPRVVALEAPSKPVCFTPARASRATAPPRRTAPRGR